MNYQNPSFSQYPHHPSLGQLVTDEQRLRAESYLQEAYADGRLNEYELDQRLGQAMNARTREDLNSAFYGLVPVSSTSQALGVHSAYRAYGPGAMTRFSRTTAAVAHFSVFFAWILGPLFFYLTGTKGSYSRREAAKAFNFQVISMVGFVTLAVLNGTIFSDRLEPLSGVLGLLWFVFTIVGGVKAAKGKDWTNPAQRIVAWKPLKD